MQDEASETPPGGGGEAEARLQQAVTAGEVADLGGATVRAEFLRALMFGGDRDLEIPPFGVRICNATISGTLNLDGCIIAVPLVLTDVRITAPVNEPAMTLRDAHIRRIAMHALSATGAVLADRAVVENGLVAEVSSIEGRVSLAGCRIGHTLSLLDCQLGDEQYALVAAGLRVDGSLAMRGSTLAGAALLPRIHVEAGFYAERLAVSITPASGTDAAHRLAVDLESSSVGGDLLLGGARITGSVRMENVRVGGRIEAIACNIDATGGAWSLGGMSVRHSFCIDEAHIKGVLEMAGADVAKLVYANRVRIEGGETSILADLLSVGGNIEMTDATLVGQLRCPGADIRGQLRLTGTKIYGSELAIRGDGSRVKGGCFFSRAQIIGVIRFPASHFGNQFRLRGASIKVDHGPALLASGSHFARDVELNGGFETIGAIVLDQTTIAGTCDLTASRIKSAAIARQSATIRQPQPARSEQAFDELALSLVDAEVSRLQMPLHGDERPRGIVNLSRARVGAYEDWANTWPPLRRRRAKNDAGRDIDHLVLDGLVYDHLVNPSGVGGEHHARDQDRAGRRRLRWLDGQHHCDVAEHFRPQPWVQLAGRFKAQGLVSDARQISVERRRRERRSHAATAVTRWESRLLDWIALFGFNPWRTVFWSLLVIVVFSGIWSLAASHCTRPGCFDQKVFVSTNLDAYGANPIEQVYPGFNPIGYAIDNFVPVASLGYADHWRPNTRFHHIAEIVVPDIPVFLSGETKRDRIFTSLNITVGGLLYCLILLEQTLGVLLISLIATGFTGILRDET